MVTTAWSISLSHSFIGKAGSTVARLLWKWVLKVQMAHSAALILCLVLSMCVLMPNALQLFIGVTKIALL